MDSEKIINYHLYIDECGDQNLEAFSPTFPIFTLCGILVRDDLVPQLEEKGTYWVTAERMKNRMLCLDFKWKSIRYRSSRL